MVTNTLTFEPIIKNNSLIESSATVSQKEITNDVFFAGLLLASLQVIDGVLTAIGVSHWGTGAEANLLIRALMDLIGHVNALIFVKSFAVIVVFSLMLLSSKVQWIGFALKALILVYLSAAVVPWTVLLIQKYI